MGDRKSTLAYFNERYEERIARCPWRYPDSIDTFIADCGCKGKKSEKCDKCKVYYLLKKYPNFDPKLKPYLHDAKNGSDEDKFFSKFNQSINNPEFIKYYDLALDITKYLKPWEYDPDYVLPRLNACSEEYDMCFIHYRAKVLKNKLLIPGMYVANDTRERYNEPYRDPVLSKVSTHSQRMCYVTEALNFFIKRINQRPLSGTDHDPDIEPKARYVKKSNYSGYGSRYIFTKSSFEVLCQLIPIVVQSQAYKQYASTLNGNVLPRHRTEFRGNIEPAAGLWDKKTYMEEVRKRKEEEDRIEEERRKEHEEWERKWKVDTRKKREAEEAVQKERKRVEEERLSKIQEERRIREERIQEEKERLRNYARNSYKSASSRGGTQVSSSRGGAQANSSRGGVQASSSRGGAQASSSRGGAQASSSRGGAQASSSRGGAQASSSRGGAQANSSRGKGKKNAWTRLY